MCKTQQWLLALVACFYCNTLYAQINLSVDIHGVDDELENNVRLYLSIEQQKDSNLLTVGRLHRLHNIAPTEIANALQPFGYYRPKINTELVKPGPEQWEAIYTIDPGPPLPISVFNFTLSEELKQDSEFQLLLEQPRLNKGDTFNHLQYEDLKNSLAKLAIERGYFRAHFIEHRVEIDLDTYEARIHLNYVGGNRYRFGEVIMQQDMLDPELLKRYVPFERGAPYTLNELMALQQALNDSDYFESVEVSPGQVQDDSDEIPVNVILTPRKRHRYTLGLGYGTDTGARAKFGWEIPRLNQAGHRINTDARISQIGYNLGIRYRVPVLNPRTDQMVYSASVENEKTDSSDSTIRNVGASLNRGRGQWRESIALNYQQEEYIVANDQGDSTLLIPSVSWSRTWGNDFINVLDGIRFDFTLRGATKKIVSDTDFYQFQGGLKGITSLGINNRIIARGQLGSTITDEFHQLPSSVRFFAGGSQSVRGYAYEELGPVDESGEVVGGKNLMVGSIEFEHNLSGKWSMAVFYDAGNAIDNINDKLERGAGFGFRWKSPVGPVRIDFASAVSREDQPWKIHINIGPDL